MTRTHEIRARIHPDAIQKTTRFFDATIDEAIGELLQNARRAGASAVNIVTSDHGVEIVDDGEGVADPAALLAFGHSGWNGRVAAEDPAGMGLYALARYRPTICSRTAGGTGWHVELDEEHFRGEKAAPVVADESAPMPSGTRISFRHDNAGRLDSAVRERGRYVPTSVRLNGKAVPQNVFIGDEGRVFEWEGARIAVYHEQWRQPRLSTEVAFHGHLVLYGGIKGVRTPDDHWWVRIDVSDCRHVELTLPRRETLVENAFLERLKLRARKAIYQTMSGQRDAVALTHEQWAEARRLGVAMPEPPARLRAWQAKTADTTGLYFHAGESKPTEVDDRHTLAPGELEPAMEQMLARALGRNSGHGLRLLRRNDDYQGFTWYDRLPQVTRIEVETTTGGTTRQLPTEGHGDDFDNERVDAVTMIAHVIEPDTGKTSSTRLASDIALGQPSGEFGGHLTGIKVTRDSAIGADELTELLGRCYFLSPAGADDDEERLERFTDDAEDTARRLLESPEDAELEAIRRSIDKSTAWRVPAGRRATIVIEHDKPTSVVIDRPGAAGP